MKENQTNKTYEFCPACRDDVEYEVKETKLNKVIKGIEISYDYKGAYCKECGEELLVKDLRDENLLKMNNAYREATNTISIDEILKILEKYNIGKRPLSIILGCGETTLTRFLDGDIPSKAYSDLLKKIGEDKEFFLELLEENEDKITSVAFKKCYEKTKEIDAMIQFSDNLSKIESVANYIIEKSSEITPLALQKLIYYSQAFFRAYFNKFMFNNDCQAWVHGPVYTEIYHKYKKHGYNPIDETLENFNHYDLSEIEIEVINSVLGNFGCYSGKILEKMTHIEMPWLETRGDLKHNEVSSKNIDKELIAKYFEEIKNKYNMKNLGDIRNYSSELFEDVRGL